MLQKHLMLLFAALVITLSACEKDPAEPNPLPVIQQPNPLPANALLKQMKWSENDYLSATYDAKNRLTQWRSQWQYVEEDPTKIRAIVYDFQYDTQDKVTKISYTGGFVTNLYYNGQGVEKAQELFPGGAVMNDFTYLYNNKRIVAIIRKIANAPGEAPTTYRYELGYDNKGNLNQIKTFEQLSQPVNGNPYKLLETTTFSDFDDKVNPIHWNLQFPYLPQVRWQFNNPRRKQIKTEGGATLVYTYTYTYDTKGLPIEQRETLNGRTKTARISY
jgi:YD repeat-containing protein